MKFKGILIVVKDCRKALKFYREMFGFELIRDNDGNMELSGNLYLQEEKYWERFTGMKFDFAVEDSPKAFRFFEHLPELKVLVFDRPWNRDCAFPNGNYQRCADWASIRRIVAGE